MQILQLISYTRILTHIEWPWSHLQTIRQSLVFFRLTCKKIMKVFQSQSHAVKGSPIRKHPNPLLSCFVSLIINPGSLHDHVLEIYRNNVFHFANHITGSCAVNTSWLVKMSGLDNRGVVKRLEYLHNLQKELGSIPAGGQ